MKKKNKALYMWAALCVLAVAAVTFDFMWDKHQIEQKSEAEKILALEPAQVKELQLVLENPASVTKDSIPVMTNRVIITRGEDGWHIKTPVDERADQDAVNGLVELLTHERASQVAVTEPIDWKSFGLDEGRGSIQIKDDQGRATMLMISSRNNFEGKPYMRRNDENKVLLAGDMWLNEIEKKLGDYRDKRILKVPVAEIKSFQVKTAKEALPFERKDDVWILSNRAEWKLDQNRVRDFLKTLTSPMVLEWKKEGAVQPADLKEFGLDKPKGTLEVEVAEGLTWTAEISDWKEPRYYLRVNDPSMIVGINSDEGNKLVGVAAEEFRDRRAPFQLGREKAAQLEIRRAGTAVKKQKGDKEFQRVVDGVRDLEAGAFLPAVKDLGTKDTTEVVVKDEAGGTLYSLTLGGLQKVKTAGGGEREMVLARSSLSGETVGVDKDQVEALGLGPLLGDKVKTAEPAPGVQDEKSH